MTSTKCQAFTVTLGFASAKPVCPVESGGKNKGVHQHQCKSIYSSAAWQVFGLQHSKNKYGGYWISPQRATHVRL